VIEELTHPGLLRGEIYSTTYQSYSTIDKSDASIISMNDRFCDIWHRLEGAFQSSSISIDSDVLQQLLKDLFSHSSQVQIFALRTEVNILNQSLRQLVHSLFKGVIFQSKQEDRECMNTSDTNAILWMAKQWWLSSCFLALTEGYDRCGDTGSSLYYARICCRLAQNSLRRLKSSSYSSAVDKSIFSALIMDSTTFASSFSSRVDRCMEFIARCYSKLGDYRKAKSYSITCSESFGLLPMDYSQSLNLLEVLRVTYSRISNVRHMQCRRSMLDLIALSTPIDKLNHTWREAVNNSLEGLIASLVLVDSSASTLDWVRENARDLLLCELSLYCTDSSRFTLIICFIYYRAILFTKQ